MRRRVVVISEIPVSYRAGWFAELQRRDDLDLHVIYLAEQQADRPWESLPTVSEQWITVQRSFDLGSVGGHVPRLSRGLGRTLTHLDPEVVVIPGWAHPACWQAVAWCRRKRRSYAVMNETWHPQGQTRLPSSITARARDSVLRGAALAMPAGQRADAYLRSLGMSHTAIVHANTCDAASISAATADVARSATPSVLYVGRLLEHKGAARLVTLGRRLAATGIEFVVAGDGPLRAEIEALAGSEPEVNYVGPVSPPDGHRLMAQAWAVVVPSFKEPWGVVVHEALAAGTPVVATTAVGSALELIDAPGVGRIVWPDVADIFDGCRSLLVGAAPDAAECRASAARITYATASDEFAAAVRQIEQAR